MVQFLQLNTNNVLSSQFDLQCDVICLSVINSLLPADFVPPSENNSSNGTSAGIVAAVVVVIFLILGILWWKGCLGQKISMRHGIF
jgi:cytoskeletal protein RodZ